MKSLESRISPVLNLIIKCIEIIGLIIIAGLTVSLMYHEVLKVISDVITLGDILLMFIYLEILAMVGIYLKSGKLPIILPIYIAIIALARFIIIDSKNLEPLELIALATGIMILAIGVVIIKYSQNKIPKILDKE